MFLTLLLFSLQLAEPRPAISLGLTRALPNTALQEIESAESTPWGTAKTRNVSSANDIGITSSITSYYFATNAAIDSAKLSHVKSHFTINRACQAQYMRLPKFIDADGKIWPQTVLRGHCVGESGFQTLFLIANGHLYRFTVALNAVQHTDATLPAPTDDNNHPATPLHGPPQPQIDSLDSALRSIVSRSSFSSIDTSHSSMR